MPSLAFTVFYVLKFMVHKVIPILHARKTGDPVHNDVAGNLFVYVC